MNTDHSNNEFCEFCNEIRQNQNNFFKSVYGNNQNIRIINQTENFIVIPTIGQLVKYHILIIPISHFENYSLLSSDLQFEAMDIIEKYKKKLKKYGNVLMFEHGASESSCGGCGIYHAHIHLVPLPFEIDIKNYFTGEFRYVNNLQGAWDILKSANEYLIAYSPSFGINFQVGNFESQHIRKIIKEKFNLKRSWNWRDYDFIEDDLLQTIKELS